jgi:hypothetical protein
MVRNATTLPPTAVDDANAEEVDDWFPVPFCPQLARRRKLRSVRVENGEIKYRLL